MHFERLSSEVELSVSVRAVSAASARLQSLSHLSALPPGLAKHDGQIGQIGLGLGLGLGPRTGIVIDAAASRRQDSAQHGGAVYAGRQEQRRLAQERAVDLGA